MSFLAVPAPPAPPSLNTPSPPAPPLVVTVTVDASLEHNTVTLPPPLPPPPHYIVPPILNPLGTFRFNSSITI